MTKTPELIFDVAHLGHVEILTPKPDASLRFFEDILGMAMTEPRVSPRICGRMAIMLAIRSRLPSPGRRGWVTLAGGL